VTQHKHYAVRLSDLTGEAERRKILGYIGSDLTSRGFVIKTNLTTSSQASPTQSCLTDPPTQTGQAPSECPISGQPLLSGGGIAGVVISSLLFGALLGFLGRYILARKKGGLEPRVPFNAEQVSPNDYHSNFHFDAYNRPVVPVEVDATRENVELPETGISRWN
jgi:hypothetical protein